MARGLEAPAREAKEDTLRRVGILTEAVEAAAGEVEAISALADSAAINALAAVKSEIAGEIRSAEGIEGLRAALGLLFERVEIVRTPIDPPPLTGIEAKIAHAQEHEYDDEEAVPALAVGDWTVTLYPRLEWIGDLDGYYREPAGCRSQSMSRR
jgi:hypothetical protein